MHIYYHGATCFKIKTNNTQLIINPFAAETGLAKRKFEGDIVLVSQQKNIDAQRVTPSSPDLKNSFIVDSPGEYEIKGVFIYGLKSDSAIIYNLKIENIGLTHLNGMIRPLNDQELEVIENTDVLFIPVGGNDTLSSKLADEIISQIEPKIVIPMDYKIPGYNIAREPLANFLSEMGIKNHTEETSLKMTTKDLPAEELKIIVLKVS